MFNLFKTKKRIKVVQNVTQLIYSALFNLLNVNSGKVPDKLKNDFYIIAYIYGITGFMTIVSQINNVRQKGFLIYEVYENLFPGSGKEITKKCNQLILNEDKQFLSTINQAQTEIQRVYENGGIGSLTSLIDYAERKYNII